MPTAVPIPRPEHPRPDFARNTFYNLNGTWQFAFDDDDRGLAERWQDGRQLPLSIVVPFCYQSEKSGLGGDEIHPILWYRRTFRVPQDMQGQRILLRFGAVDYACDVYINGTHVGHHVGGYSPFALDITLALQEGDNDLCLRVTDYPDCTQTRGKQYWKRGLMGCWYTPTSGIWQTVYLEAVGARHFTQIHVTPDIDRQMATAELALDIEPLLGTEVELTLSFQGDVLRTLRTNMPTRHMQVPFSVLAEVGLRRMHLWSPGNPDLYDLNVKLLNADTVLDEVNTYFGMRKVEVVNGEVLLNNRTLYQRLVLDQGYWPDTLLTPPSDEAIKADVEWTLKLGFNGARKHQKIEDPRYYYWADKLGMLVWSEVPSPYDFTRDTVRNFADTFLDSINRDYNHPCIIAWTPVNESWGVPDIYADKRQQATAKMLYYLAKAADGTRFVSTNDGWEQVTSDICALHDYSPNYERLSAHFADREQVEKTTVMGVMAYAQGETPQGHEAFLVTEFGGIAMATIGPQGKMGGMDTWGYYGKAEDEEAFFDRFDQVFSAVQDIPYCRGYCYTQLTDVQQEINGLLTPDRQPKVDVERIRAINVNPLERKR